MQVKNKVLISKNFFDSLKKIHKADLLLKDRIKVSEFCTFYDKTVSNITKILSDYYKKEGSEKVNPLKIN